MAYTAQKPCSFAGNSYRVGNTIPDSVLLPGAIQRLLKAGVIAESGAGPLLPAPASLEVTIPLAAEDRDEEIKLTVEQLVDVLEIVQHNEDDVIAFIEKSTSEEQLKLIDTLYKSESVYEAAKLAAEKLICEPEMVAAHIEKEELNAMSYSALKKLAKEMGVSASGTKEELVERIAAEEVYVEAPTEGEK